MKPETWPRIRSLFEGALELEPDRRAEFLARECGSDLELLQEVRSLLRADAGECATPLVEGDPGMALASRDLIGSTLAGFEIVRQIGAGGMGAVYEARQQRPQRVVALKMLAVRFPSERARRRFEDEADILARLSHPAIAQVLEAGSARLGGVDVPWFAMELVEAPRPIDHFVREQALDAHAVVKLFMTVCDAVHYAHQRSVIHRDLKPANVLVDRHGQVKVIDFGIARLADRDAMSRFTRTGEILGTLAYMSPERLERAEAGDATTADVYALGVILYELLAGRSPFQLDKLPPARAMEVLRAADPAPLSRVNRGVPGELDWITSKAMAREPALRYASVAELAQDLERYGRGEPVVAGPPSATYRLRKLAWRHRVLLGVAAAAFVAVSIGFVVALQGWRRVAAAERLASRKAAVLAEVNRFQEGILGAAYGTEKGADIRLADVIDRAAADLERRQFADPIVEIGARTSMGVSYVGLGRFQDAERELVRARALLAQHGLDPREGWGIALGYSLGLVYSSLGKLDLAEGEVRTALGHARAAYGTDHQDVATGQYNLATLLIKQAAFTEALELATLANRWFAQHRGEHSEHSICARAEIGQALAGLGRDQEAERVFEEVRVLADQHMHQDHPSRLGVLAIRADFLRKLGRFAEHLRVCEEIAAVHERVHGSTHPATLLAWNNLATGQAELGQNALAEATLRRVVAARESLGIRDGFECVVTLHNLTTAVRWQGRTAEAEEMARELRATAARSLPEGHWAIGVVTKEHGGCLRELGRLEEAETALLLAYELLERAVSAVDIRTREVAIELAALYKAWDRPQDVAKWMGKHVSGKQ